jgi:hypothetical protein
MTHESRRQEKLDAQTFWTGHGVDRSQNQDDRQCESGTMQGPRPGQYGTRNPETTKGGEETVEMPGMQKRPKRHRSETAVEDPDPRRQLRLRIEKT